MSAEPWSVRPKIDALSLDDILMRRTPLQSAKNQEIPFSDVLAFLQGSAITLVASEADLPPLIDNSHVLDPLKNYIFTEPNSFANPIVIPAGYIGWIRSNFLSVGTIDYTGIGSFYKTLNTEGTITATAPAGPGTIFVLVSAPHGLFNGQFVNITGTTNYNQQRLKISNVTPTSFDVQIGFVGDESGAFNTGFDALQITNIDFTNFTGGANLFDLTSSGSITSFLVTDFMTELGFDGPGIIRNCPSVGMRINVLGFILDGLTLEDCTAVNISGSNIVDLLGITAGATGLTIQGSATARVVVSDNSIDLFDTSQHPVKINSDINASASITIQNSPDNLVATDYFDTVGGLDQTDPRVITLNNGARADSMTLAEARSSGILVVDGSGGIDEPIVDISPSPGDWIQDPSTEEFTVDTTTGLITYNGLKPRSVKIEYSLEATQSANPSQNLILDLHINGTLQPKTVRTLTTTGGTFLPVSYDGGNFLINPGDTFQIFKENTSTTEDTDVQNATLLITRN